MIKPHELFEVWAPDEVAECFENVPAELYSSLWNFVANYPKPNGYGDDFADRALKNWWNHLTPDQQTWLNEAAQRHLSSAHRASFDVASVEKA